MLADKIIAQRECGLITSREARAALRRIAKQSRFNADYSDHLDSHKRWTNEERAATRALSHWRLT